MKSFGIKIILLLLLLLPYYWAFNSAPNESEILAFSATINETHWLVLNRDMGKEYVYYGIPGNKEKSELLKEFDVKTGAFWSPTPLPELLGRDYWLIVDKTSSEGNSETAPYFLQLDVPVEDEWPYGPVPYTECKDIYSGEPIQCDWVIPGYFGLHGINGDPEKLSDEDFGSSGCIRHRDEDITYLYNLLDPQNEEIRYYIEN